MVEPLFLVEGNLLIPGYYQLGNAITMVDGEILFAMVYEQNLHFSAIVGIDGTRTVEHRDPCLCSKPRAGSDLSLKALGKGYGETGGNLRIGAAGYSHILFKAGA